MRLYEVKTTSFCASRYRVRCPEGGLTWADKRACDAVKERDDQAAVLDNGLFSQGHQLDPHGDCTAQAGRGDGAGGGRVL